MKNANFISLFVIIGFNLGFCFADAPQPFRIDNAAPSSLTRLSPDLREKAAQSSRENVLVCALVEKNTRVEHLMIRSVRSRILGDIQWVTGEIPASRLKKLAGTNGVLSVISTETYKPLEIIETQDERIIPPSSSIELLKILKTGEGAPSPGQLDKMKFRSPEGIEERTFPPLIKSMKPSLKTLKVKDIHGASAAWAKGFNGKGIVAAVVDSGVDFSHPDLQGSQARIQNGPYEGWPFAYDTISGFNYALSHIAKDPYSYWKYLQNTMYCQTLPIINVSCHDGVCTAALEIASNNKGVLTLPFSWAHTSQSGQYRYTVHPDFSLLSAGYLANIGYGASFLPPAVIVSDENTSGVYDTVYVDMDFDKDFRDEKPMRKGDELAGADLYDAGGNVGADGVWDLSAGMLSWISDGKNPPPGVETLYPGQAETPGAGELVCFITDSGTHGTHVAGDIAARGVITDPERWGPINPLFAGGVNVGGAGGAVLSGMAPESLIAAFQNGYNLPFDSWTLAMLGFDGIPESGDEAHIINNSWGYSNIINDGWDQTSRFANYMNLAFAPRTSILAATGNGGSGYGTVTAPSGGTILDVGASTSYGSIRDFGLVYPSQFTWGNVMFWSNRGPGMAGDVAPDIVAVGSLGTGAEPLNNILYYKNSHFAPNGQASYGGFSGTSMSSPITAGILALAYQAYYENHGIYPTWEEARNLLLNGAIDLGYDALTQGSGNVNADRSTDIATSKTWSVEPVQWVPGKFRDKEYSDFPRVMHPGDEAVQSFHIINPTTNSLSLDISDHTLIKLHETLYDLEITTGSVPHVSIPTWIQDITPDIEKYDADLVRAQVVFPFDVFDINRDYNIDFRLTILFLDWTDWNKDGDLWLDANGNGIIDSGEIDIDPVTYIYEFNRMSYAYPSGTSLEAGISRDAISRRHDGVFFGIQRRNGTRAVKLKVRLAYYKRTDWDWAETSENAINIPAGQRALFEASLTIPSETGLGVYQGGLVISDGSLNSMIPIVVHVAASGPEFKFGASSLKEPPGDLSYDNSHVSGAFDWSWRYETGDWRLFYFDVPDGSTSPGKALFVDTQWQSVPTDVDTWVFGPVTDKYSDFDPSFFGPYTSELIGGSNNMYYTNGIFVFDTITKGPRDIVKSEIRDGLNFLALHNVLYAGLEYAEPIMGKTFLAQTTPFPVIGKGPRGEWTQTIISGDEIPGELRVRAFGLSRARILSHQTIFQDDPDDPCTASWQYGLRVVNCNYLEIATSGTADMDIDLYVHHDNGDGIWGCEPGGDILVEESASPGSGETITMSNIGNGLFWIIVHGYLVPGGDQPFDISIHPLEGNNLKVKNLPPGSIPTGEALTFDVEWTKMEWGMWEGLVIIGTTIMPDIFQVPIQIEVEEQIPKAWILH